jgi:hypothetical protein
MTEHKMAHPVLSWLVIIGTAVGTVVWGGIICYSVKDSYRHFDVGQINDTPARTTYSTVVPESPAKAPTQLPLLPATGPSTQEARR